MFGMCAADKCMKAFEFVDQALLQQEIEGPVYRGRRGIPGCDSHAVEYLVSAERFVGSTKQFKHRAAPGRESHPPFSAQLFRTAQDFRKFFLVHAPHLLFAEAGKEARALRRATARVASAEIT